MMDRERHPGRIAALAFISNMAKQVVNSSRPSSVVEQRICNP